MVSKLRIIWKTDRNNALSGYTPTTSTPPPATGQPMSTQTDDCGCAVGSGWSLKTGVGCCKPGSNTQSTEIASCQVAGLTMRAQSDVLNHARQIFTYRNSGAHVRLSVLVLPARITSPFEGDRNYRPKPKHEAQTVLY